MKWGIRRARKKGETYTYKSRAQKRYEKKLDKQTSKNASAAKIQKTRDKLNRYRHRDANRQDYAQTTSVGKTIVKGLLMGPIGSGNYNRMRASGSGRIGAAFVSNWLSSTVALPLTMMISKSVETGHARDQANFEKRMNSQKRNV